MTYTTYIHRPDQIPKAVKPYFGSSLSEKRRNKRTNTISSGGIIRVECTTNQTYYRIKRKPSVLRQPKSFKAEKWDIVLDEEYNGHSDSKIHLFSHNTPAFANNGPENEYACKSNGVLHLEQFDICVVQNVNFHKNSILILLL